MDNSAGHVHVACPHHRASAGHRRKSELWNSEMSINAL